MGLHIWREIELDSFTLRKMAEHEANSAAQSEEMEIASTRMDYTEQNSPSMQDRNHLTMFRAGLDQCIDKCLDPKVFGNYYKPIWENNKDMLEAIICQVMTQAKDKVKEELVNTFTDEDLGGSLGLMDEILKESHRTDREKEAWRPTGDPEADSRAYFMALKKRKLEELEKELLTTKNEERMLREEVEEKREKLFATEDEIKLANLKAKRVVDNVTEFELQNDSFLNSFKAEIDIKTHFENDADVSMET